MICCDSYPAGEVFGMGCGHLFCLVRAIIVSSLDLYFFVTVELMGKLFFCME